MAGNVRFGRGAAGAAGAPGPAGPSGDVWTKYTVTFQDFIDGGTGVVTLQNFPALTVIENAIMKTSIAFDAGGGIVPVRLFSLPAVNPLVTLIDWFNLETAVDPQNFALSNYLYMGSFANGDYNARLEVDTGEVVLGDLVAGSVDVWLKKSLLP